MDLYQRRPALFHGVALAIVDSSCLKHQARSVRGLRRKRGWTEVTEYETDSSGMGSLVQHACAKYSNRYIVSVCVHWRTQM